MRRATLLPLGLILLLATGLRVYNLSLLGFWTDELCTLSEVDGHGLQLHRVPTDVILPPMVTCTRLAQARPAWAIVPGLAHDDTHPPVYFLLLRGWETLFGDGEAGVRSLDVCFGVAAVGLLFVAARPDVGTPAALWAALLMAVAAPQVQFAQEARNYMPAVTLSLAAAVAARRVAVRSSVGSAVALAVCVSLMGLTHYYTVAVAAALAVHAGLTLRGRPLGYTVAAFAAAAVAVVLLWGWALPLQRPTFAAQDWMRDGAPGHATRAWMSLARLSVRWVADVDGSAVALIGAGLFVVMAVTAVRVGRPLRLWVLWAVVPTLLVAVSDLTRGTTQLSLLRYTLLATPGAYVLMAAAGRRTAWVIPGVAVVAALLALPSTYAPPWKLDLRTPTQIVGRQLGPDDGLVISGPDPIAAQIVSAAFRHYLPTMPPATVVLTRPADGPTLARLSACPRVWVLWLWPDRPIRAFVRGYQIDDAGPLPPAGTLAVGRVTRADAAR